MDEELQLAIKLFETHGDKWDRQYYNDLYDKGYTPHEIVSWIDKAKLIVDKPISSLYTVFDKKAFRKWYQGPHEKTGHWPQLKRYFEEELSWPDEVIDSVNSSSSEVTGLLGNPKQFSDYSVRGLVLGYVQSGKTANMTAVIAKAVDAGYNTVIILAGLTNALRKQTQDRIVRDLCKRRGDYWEAFTSSEQDLKKDETRALQSSFHKGHPIINLLVVKKNVTPLSNLLELIDRTRKDKRSQFNELRVLLIDDECDQASVNSSEGDITAINGKIRQIIKALPCVSYVGYTATPFANVLISPFRDRAAERADLDDLYPSDFITSLPRPNQYFGAEKMFGRASLSDDEDEQGVDVWRQVSDEDALYFRASNDDAPATDIPDSLQDAIDYFLLTCAVRRFRGQADKHMSMLIHTSHTVNEHEEVKRRIHQYLASYYGAEEAFEYDEDGDPVFNYLTDNLSVVKKSQLESIWNREKDRCAGETVQLIPDFKQLFEHFPDVLDALSLKKENGQKGARRVSYDNGPVTDIVVGGTILSRGLTIEGLCVSFFVRSSTQYDALLQMGRWFGYRIGYEDLPRLYTTKKLYTSYRDLADIEAEIREFIEQYDETTTPMDLAVRIRVLPGMMVTRKSVMGSAVNAQVSYWGTRQQFTKYHHKDPVEIENNWKAVSEFLDGCVELAGKRSLGERRVWRNIPLQNIMQFVSAYKTHAQKNFSPALFEKFLSENVGQHELAKWTVALVEPGKGKLSGKSLGQLGDVKLNNRSQANPAPSDDLANIRALMSANDVFYDQDHKSRFSKWKAIVNERNEISGIQPLLLVYVIDKDSVYTGKNEEIRMDLNAVDHLIGLGVVFNGDVERSNTWIQVDMAGMDSDEESAEIADEQREAATILEMQNETDGESE